MQWWHVFMCRFLRSHLQVSPCFSVASVICYVLPFSWILQLVTIASDLTFPLLVWLLRIDVYCSHLHWGSINSTTENTPLLRLEKSSLMLFPSKTFWFLVLGRLSGEVQRVAHFPISCDTLSLGLLGVCVHHLQRLSRNQFQPMWVKDRTPAILHLFCILHATILSSFCWHETNTPSCLARENVEGPGGQQGSWWSLLCTHALMSSPPPE